MYNLQFLFTIIFILFAQLSFGQINSENVDKINKEAIKLVKSQSADDIEKAYALAQNILDYSKEVKNIQQQINAQRLIARYHDRKGDYRSSIKHSLLIVSLIPQNPNLLYEKSLRDFINLLNRYKFYQEALKYERLLIRIERSRRSNPNTISYKHLASIFTCLQMRDSAIYYRELGLKRASIKKDPNFVMGSYNDLGVTFSKFNEWNNASDCFLKADSIFQLNKLWNKNDSILHAYVIGNWGRALFNLGDYKRGRTFLSYDIKLNIEKGDLTGALNAMIILAQNLIQLESYIEAITTIENGLEIIDQSNETHEMIRLEFYQSLTECYQGLNNGKKANFYFKSFRQLKDSLNHQNYRNLQDMEYAFIRSDVGQEIAMEKLEFERDKNEFERIKESERNNRIILGIVIFAVISAAAGIFYILLKRKKYEKELSKKELENKTLELTYKQKVLTDLALNLNQRKVFSKKIIDKIKRLKGTNLTETNALVQFINAEIGSSDPEITKELNESFMFKLRQQYPQLSEKDKELCTMVRLKLSNKQIAIRKGIAIESVSIAKNRLKKKMNISESLFDIISKI